MKTIQKSDEGKDVNKRNKKITLEERKYFHRRAMKINKYMKLIDKNANFLNSAKVFFSAFKHTGAKKIMRDSEEFYIQFCCFLNKEKIDPTPRNCKLMMNILFLKYVNASPAFILHMNMKDIANYDVLMPRIYEKNTVFKKEYQYEVGEVSFLNEKIQVDRQLLNIYEIKENISAFLSALKDASDEQDLLMEGENLTDISEIKREGANEIYTVLRHMMSSLDAVFSKDDEPINEKVKEAFRTEIKEHAEFLKERSVYFGINDVAEGMKIVAWILSFYILQHPQKTSAHDRVDEVEMILEKIYHVFYDIPLNTSADKGFDSIDSLSQVIHILKEEQKKLGHGRAYTLVNCSILLLSETKNKIELMNEDYLEEINERNDICDKSEKKPVAFLLGNKLVQDALTEIPTALIKKEREKYKNAFLSNNPLGKLLRFFIQDVFKKENPLLTRLKKQRSLLSEAESRTPFVSDFFEDPSTIIKKIKSFTDHKEGTVHFYPVGQQASRLGK